MDFVMDICDNLTVLNFGEILAEGDKASIRQHKGVREAYLGTGG
jgi:branched-chain amino acid transport system ATP-binding protein